MGFEKDFFLQSVCILIYLEICSSEATPRFCVTLQDLIWLCVPPYWQPREFILSLSNGSKGMILMDDSPRSQKRPNPCLFSWAEEKNEGNIIQTTCKEQKSQIREETFSVMSLSRTTLSFV